MADTRPQLEVEDWVRENWLANEFGQKFYRDRVRLSSGGVFDFDAVSVDQRVVASISTSQARTAGGNLATGKMMKLRSDMLFLTMVVTAERRLIVLTSECMFHQCLKESKGGRVPPEVEFLLADIPDELERKLISARRVASTEVSPSK
jgi:hypothetical protein